MGHGRDKPKKEKRKPKQEKTAAVKSVRQSEVLEHIAQHPRPDTERAPSS